MTIPPEPLSKSFTSEGLTLNYVDWGNDTAPPLLLVHGVRDHARSWDPTALALRDTWHVMVIDLRGHGDSAWSPDGAYLTSYHVLDVAALVDSLGYDKLTIVGHSLGGSITSRYAASFPERVEKLVLVDGFGPTGKHYAAWDKQGALQRTREWIAQRRDPKSTASRRLASLDEAVKRIMAGNARLTPELARHLAVHGTVTDGDGYRWKFDPRTSMFTPEDFASRLSSFWPAIGAPTLLCYGAQSWSANPEADASTITLPNHEVVAIDDASHWPHHDNFPAFIAALRAFL